MNIQVLNKLHLYQITVIFSVIFALLGFSYNVWRMEVSEENSNIRTACFEMLINLSSLEQQIYAAHYDGDKKQGNPRNGWVTVGLIADLSALTDDAVKKESIALKETWSAHWETIPTSKNSVDKLVGSIDSVRAKIKYLLSSLE